jgi:cell division transport system ATP-binding protein
MSVPIIELTNISAGFKQKVVLEDLSLTVEKGSMILIEGATGCGKTTLMKLLIGALPPSAGFGRVMDHDLPGIAPQALTGLRRRLGIVFQTPRFLDGESVLTNVALPLAIAGKTRSACRSRGTVALLDTDLASQSRKRPFELSGGEQARLQIARALIHSPNILLADEPFAHLDSDSARAAEKLVMHAHERGMTVVVTTHRPTHLADRARRFVLEQGALYPC